MRTHHEYSIKDEPTLDYAPDEPAPVPTEAAERIAELERGLAQEKAQAVSTINVLSTLLRHERSLVAARKAEIEGLKTRLTACERDRSAAVERADAAEKDAAHWASVAVVAERRADAAEARAREVVAGGLDRLAQAWPLTGVLFANGCSTVMVSKCVVGHREWCVSLGHIEAEVEYFDSFSVAFLRAAAIVGHVTPAPVVAPAAAPAAGILSLPHGWRTASINSLDDLGND